MFTSLRYFKKTASSFIDWCHFNKINEAISFLSASACKVWSVFSAFTLHSTFSACFLSYSAHVHPCTQRLLRWLKKRVKRCVTIQTTSDLATKLQTSQFVMSMVQSAFNFHFTMTDVDQEESIDIVFASFFVRKKTEVKSYLLWKR